jgi:hypothetical protein
MKPMSAVVMPCMSGRIPDCGAGVSITPLNRIRINSHAISEKFLFTV